MADKFSRFSRAVTIRKKDDSMNMLMKHWISNFGAPLYIYNDNGGEFIRDSFYDIYRNFNIKVSEQHHSSHGVTTLVRETLILQLQCYLKYTMM